jgi:hypothetical protein
MQAGYLDPGMVYIVLWVLAVYGLIRLIAWFIWLAPHN